MKALFKKLIFLITTIFLLNSCSKDDKATYELETPSNIAAEDYTIYQTAIQTFQIGNIGLKQRTSLNFDINKLQEYTASLSEDNPGFEPEILSDLVTVNQYYSVLNNNFNTYLHEVQLIPEAQLNSIFHNYQSTTEWSKFYDSFPGILSFSTFSNVAYNTNHTSAIFASHYDSLAFSEGVIYYLEKENQVWVVKKSIETPY